MYYAMQKKKNSILFSKYKKKKQIVELLMSTCTHDSVYYPQRFSSNLNTYNKVENVNKSNICVRVV